MPFTKTPNPSRRGAARMTAACVVLAACGTSGSSPGTPPASEASGGVDASTAGSRPGADAASAFEGADSSPGGATDAALAADGATSDGGPSADTPPVPPYTCLRDFSVATTGVDAAGCGSSAMPCATMAGANKEIALQAGDCVDVAAGPYPTGGISLTKGGNAANPTGYVVYRSAPNHGAHLEAASSSASTLLDLRASYLVIDGFEIDGKKETTDNAYLLNGGGVKPDFVHHFMVLDNLVHDGGGGGIGFQWTDYVLIRGNVIYGTTSSWDSGISVWEPVKIPGFSATLDWDTQKYHIQIVGNVSHDNGGGTPGGNSAHTDGNGIEADDWQCAQWSGGPGAYPYSGLIEENAVYGNGGAGIEVGPTTVNVDVVNNTAYGDHTDAQSTGTWRGELSNETSSNVNWWNNVAYATPSSDGGTRDDNTALLWAGASSVNVTWISNVAYNAGNGVNGRFCAASVQVNATSDDTGNCLLITGTSSLDKIGVDPVFASLSPLDLHLGSKSPATKSTKDAVTTSLPSDCFGSGQLCPPDFLTCNADGGLCAQAAPPTIGAYTCKTPGCP